MSAAPFRAFAAFVALALGAAACGAGQEPIDRASAIEEFETTGVSNAEATCIADSLVLLDELAAADPRSERTDAERDALVNARNRCLSFSPEIEVAGVQQESATKTGLTVERSVAQGADLEEVESASDAELEAASSGQLRTEAIATLVLLGRSLDNANCVVDQMLATEVDHAVFVAEGFGLGLEPLEASAFVACNQVD